MSERRYSVNAWCKEALQAASMSVGMCQHGYPPTIGIDLHAQDGTVFAHGHFDVETAINFVEKMSEACEQALTEAMRNGGTGPR